MKGRPIVFVSLLLNLALIGFIALLFKGGNRRPGTENRIEVSLSKSQKIIYLGNMRLMSESFQKTLEALSRNRMEDIPNILSGSGISLAETSVAMEPGFLVNLPASMQRMDLEVYGAWDGIAESVREGISREELSGQLADLLAKCNECHRTYSLAP